MALNHLPERLHSQFSDLQPNEEIFIKDVIVRAQLGNEPLSGPGSLYLTWHPSPRLILKTQIIPEPVAAMELYITGGSTELTVEGVEADWRMTRSSPLGGITFQTNPATVSHLAEVKFHLVNFVNYLGTGTRIINSTTISPSRLTLKSTRWQVILDSLASAKDNVEIMNEVGGYAITHVGLLTQVSGSSFSSDDAATFLKMFVRFLSFAQGRWTLPVLVDGFDNEGKLVWTSVAPLTNNDPWHYADSWFCAHEAVEILPPIFEGFMNRLEEPDWAYVFQKSVYWYVLANSNNSIETSVILVQAALELLAWYVMSLENVISRGTYNSKNTDDKIRLLLSHCKIPVEIPKSLPELANYGTAKNVDGPGAINRIRIQIIHPRKSSTNNKEIVEARQLGLWYIELVVLRLCDYFGRYSSRVAEPPRYAGQLLPVPWSIPS